MKCTPSGELFTQVVLEIFKLGGMLNAEGDKLTEEFGLSSARWKILGAIETSNSSITVPQIGRVMGQSRQAVQRLVDAMAQLPYEQHEVIVMRAYAGLKFKAIAKMQNESINTIQSRYRYGLNKLRSILNGEVIK